MRAGLLSDPRVVSLLRTLFVPVHISACNTPDEMRDARDAALLAKYDATTFRGGEREAFVLPDGTMQQVFLSLNGCDLTSYSGGRCHYTAEARRDEGAVRLFRHRGALALKALHGDLPGPWRETWDGGGEATAAIEAAAPVWPEPGAGEQGFRVFVRNSYRMYDDLHGAELALVDAATASAWGTGLSGAGDEAALPRPAFVALARAMVPRGQVATWLAESSIAGELVLHAEHVDEHTCSGVVTGRFDLAPQQESEAGKRPEAACRFRSTGQLAGRFVWDREGRCLRELRVVAVDVAFEWLPRTGPDRQPVFAPRHQVGIEWLNGPTGKAR
ncbi:MAG TPA: hypothetical protein VFZ65_02790 [Planctomycetota bacterium]|nr:hypothetical protein [Planctomycetota bacterium]